jgi:hypothetical protein
MLWRRIELDMQCDAIANSLQQEIEKERRGKAAAERLIVEAPCLDWAMSVTAELDRLEDESHDVTESDVAEKVKALEAAGLGEASSSWKVSIAGEVDEELSTSLGSFMALHVDDPYYDDDPQPSSMAAQLIEFELAVMAFVRSFNATDEAEAIKAVNRARQTILIREAQRPYNAPADSTQQSRADNEARYQYRRKIAEARTEQAVNVIHTHARRFLTPMSLREHDFLRSVIQEEIEKVVGGVL